MKQRPKHLDLGCKSEEIASMFLVKQGFKVINRNYLRKWGEIDIIATRKKELHFIEVKSVSCVTLKDITCETGYRPEDNLHQNKQNRLKRAIASYILEEEMEDREWIFDLICVYVSESENKALVKALWDVVL